VTSEVWKLAADYAWLAFGFIRGKNAIGAITPGIASGEIGTLRDHLPRTHPDIGVLREV
jgi:hypothetical protein